VNKVAGTHVLFLASLISNDATLSQFSVLIVLLQSFIKSLTIVLPFYPVGTNERVDMEGKVATANTYAMLFSSLPSCGKPVRLMIYDIHALQERFYFHGSIIPSLHSALPLLIPRLEARNITSVAFPDDGAAKRFGHFFRRLGYDIIVCGKVRVGTKRIVTIQDGDPTGRRVVIIDDLAQTGGTLYEAGLQLKRHGAYEVYAYVTHGVFPGESWKRFLYGHAHVDMSKLSAPTPFSSPAVHSHRSRSLSDLASPPSLSLPPSAVMNNEHQATMEQTPSTPASLSADESRCPSGSQQQQQSDVLFEKFWITNSIPHTIDRVPSDDVFEVIDLLPQIIHDLEFRGDST
jgi:phosphoribosylpyrophosphate synthetase